MPKIPTTSEIPSQPPLIVKSTSPWGSDIWFEDKAGVEHLVSNYQTARDYAAEQGYSGITIVGVSDNELERRKAKRTRTVDHRMHDRRQPEGVEVRLHTSTPQRHQSVGDKPARQAGRSETPLMG